MKLSPSKLLLTLTGILTLIVVLPLLVVLLITQQNQKHQIAGASRTAALTPTSSPGTMELFPLLSRNVPVFASSEDYPASYANDANYDTIWRSQGAPAWLAYDLSSVPASRRGKVLLVWYNESYNYDHTINGFPTYNMPQDYTIDVNASKAGGKPPDAGWRTLVAVRGNHYHSRQHVLDMAGYNWIRINVSAVDGAPQNYDVSLNMDIYDADAALADDWIFFGDSITAGAMGHSTVDGVPSFAQLINEKLPGYFPVQEAGGIAYLKSSDGSMYISTWLQLFPGKYVVLSYGTNDATSCLDAATVYQHFVAMVQAVLDAHKVPIVPHLPWGSNANIQQCGPAINAKIDELYQAFPQIVKGPDLWSFFQQHQSLISNDGIHPTPAGYGAYRQQWADTMLNAVYLQR